MQPFVKSNIVVALSLSCIAIASCYSPPAVVADSPTVSSVGVANPASLHCLEKGFELKSILSEVGVPVGAICFDPETQKSCEEWAFFRKECSMTITLK